MKTEGWIVWLVGAIFLWLAVDSFAINFIPDINSTGKFIVYMLFATIWIAITNIAFDK